VADAVTDDDEDTERGHRRARSQWGDTQRVRVGEGHRRPRHAQVMPVAVPLRETITDTFELLEREELSHAEIEIVRRSKRSSDDPATFADLVKLAVQRARREEAEDSTAKAIEQQVIAAIDSSQQDARGVKSDLKLIKIIGGTAITLVLGSMLWAVERIWTSAERVGATMIRLQHVEDTLNRFYSEIRDIKKDKP
jgi:hypothetical protein